MSPIVSPVTTRLSRVYQHMKAHMKRLLSRFKIFARKEIAEVTPKHAGTPVPSVQWPLDSPYSENPHYHQTVVYVDLNAQDQSESDKKTSQTTKLPKITHYPPTHRLH